MPTVIGSAHAQKADVRMMSVVNVFLIAPAPGASTARPHAFEANRQGGKQLCKY